MVDNRGISPISNYMKPGDANSMANKMSDEKQGQGGEYFAQEMQEDDSQNSNRENYQDRSAQLRASLNGLAMANAGSIMVMKTIKEREKEKRADKKDSSSKEEALFEEE